MFTPKQSHPKWYLRLYPYLFFLRYKPKYFFRIITGRVNWGWHYEWEHLENQQEDLYESEALEKAKKKWSDAKTEKDIKN
jgi:hypothetical protein